MKYEIIPATDEDMIRFFGISLAACNWHGWCMRKGKLVKALAGVVQVDDGRYFGYMELRRAARAPLTLRHIKRALLHLAEEHNIKEVYTPCDLKYPNAEMFLKRIGFEKTDEYVQEQRVWKWQVPL